MGLPAYPHVEEEAERVSPDGRSCGSLPWPALLDALEHQSSLRPWRALPLVGQVPGAVVLVVEVVELAH